MKRDSAQEDEANKKAGKRCTTGDEYEKQLSRIQFSLSRRSTGFDVPRLCPLKATHQSQNYYE